MTDGRTRRRERSFERLADAYLELLREGETQPNAEQVAKRAGVSRRLVFNHFKNLEGLFEAVIAAQMTRLSACFALAECEGEFDVRLRRFVKARCDLYEQIEPVRRSGISVSSTSSTIREALSRFRAVKRKQAARVFEPELRAFSGVERRQRRASVELVTSFSAWSALSHEQDAAPAEVRAILRRSLRALLERADG